MSLGCRGCTALFFGWSSSWWLGLLRSCCGGTCRGRHRRRFGRSLWAVAVHDAAVEVYVRNALAVHVRMCRRSYSWLSSAESGGTRHIFVFPVKTTGVAHCLPLSVATPERCRVGSAVGAGRFRRRRRRTAERCLRQRRINVLGALFPQGGVNRVGPWAGRRGHPLHGCKQRGRWRCTVRRFIAGLL